MKKIITIVSVVMLCASSCGQSAAKKQEEHRKNIEDAHVRQQSNENHFPSINEQFVSYFPDIVLGKHNVIRKFIPQEIIEEFLPDLSASIGYYNTNIKFYAVGKITNYKGLDLFIFDYEGERPDEDIYDNHIQGLRYYLLFKNGVPLTAHNETGEEFRVRNALNSHYYGEGGETFDKSYFDTDTTIVRYSHCSESGATGYTTPLVSIEKFRTIIKNNAEEEVIEITQLEYSSPFYDRNFLKKQDWNDVETIGFNGIYPTKDNRWNLIHQFWDSFYFELFTNPVNIVFHIEKINGELIPVFETYNADSKQIDRYIVGQLQNDKLIKKDYDARGKILKCPIIIKTSDGDLELLPNGKLILQNKQ